MAGIQQIKTGRDRESERSEATDGLPPIKHRPVLFQSDVPTNELVPESTVMGRS